MVNEYTNTWFELFLSRMDDVQTSKEVRFILSQIRVGIDTKLLDIACGNGRHLRKLAAHEMEVFGIDINEEILQKAREEVPFGKFFNLDMRHLDQLNEDKFDVITIMWQSFGYFDDSTNRNILENIYQLMEDAGTFILDIYNRDFFQNHQGVRYIDKDGKKIEETKFIKDNRLEVHLQYGTNIAPDTFNWRVYSKSEFSELVEDIGFKLKLSCTNFDPTNQEFDNSPRIQYVLAK